MTTRVMPTSNAKTTVAMLRNRTRTNNRTGAGQPIAMALASTRPRVIADTILAIPAAIRINPIWR